MRKLVRRCPVDPEPISTDQAGITQILRTAVQEGASDLHFKASEPVLIRIKGSLLPLKVARLTPDATEKIFEVLRPKHLVARRRRRGAGAGLLVRPGRNRALPRQRLPPAREPRARDPGDPEPDPRLEGAQPAGRAAEARGGAARADPRHGHDRQRQVHHARRGDQPDQPLAHRARGHDRGPDRVPVPEQEVVDRAARDRRRHRELRLGAALRAAPGPGRDHDRRDARHRDHRHRAEGGRDRPPGDQHRAHHGRRQDRAAPARRLHAVRAGDDAHAARREPARGRLAAPAAAPRRQGRRPGGGGDGRDARHPGVHPRREPDAAKSPSTSRRAATTACRPSTSTCSQLLQSGAISKDVALTAASSPADLDLQIRVGVPSEDMAIERTTTARWPKTSSRRRSPRAERLATPPSPASARRRASSPRRAPRAGRPACAARSATAPSPVAAASALRSRQKPTASPASAAAPSAVTSSTRRAAHGHAQHVGLELHQEVVRGRRRRPRAARRARGPRRPRSTSTTSRVW